MPKSATLLVIRHAEKSGDPEDRGLTAAGQARAQAYAAYFRTLELDGARVEPPRWLYAAADDDDSKRSRLTLEPLAVALDVAIDASIPGEDYERLAAHIRDDARHDHATTLVCWSHKKLPGLARALGAPESLVPEEWPDDVFGWLLRLDFDAAGELARATLDNQRLMFSDGGISP